jgi:hypothetical protein
VNSKAEVIERERRWGVPAALCVFASVILFIVSSVLASGVASTSHEAELLRSVDSDSGTYLLAGILRGLANLLWIPPLLFLFRAAQARSPSVRPQFAGTIFAGPLFLGAGAVLSTMAAIDAASDYVSGGGGSDEVARHLIDNASLGNLATGVSFAGALGFAAAMVYTCLWAMRTGLLTRFWGSLGLALGAISILLQFIPFLLLWFVYLALLISGWYPRRPPAWDAGEAIPWPSAGEQMAGEDAGPGGPEPVAETTARPLPGDPAEAPADSPRERGERRKRKRRS